MHALEPQSLDRDIPPTGLALFGMSADPPTQAHQEIMQWLAPQFQRVIVWAADNPFKTEQTSLHHRQAMLGLLVGELQSTYGQIQHQPALSYPYTLHSVQAAHRYWPQSQFTLVVGSDILPKLGQWHQVELLFQLVDFLVLARPGAPLDTSLINSLTVRGGRFQLGAFTGPDISSTVSRQAAQPENLLPVIAQYVSQHGLYQASLTAPANAPRTQPPATHFPTSDKAEFTVGVDNVVFAVDSQANRLLVLLSQRQQAPYQGWYGLPGTLVRAGEGLEAAAYRVLAEKLALRTLYLEQLYTFDGLGKRQPFARSQAEGEPINAVKTPESVRSGIRYLSVSYFALIPYGAAALMVSAEAGGAWFPVHEVPPLAFDHADILAYGHRRLKNKLEYSPVAFDVLPPKFTLNEVYQFYSTVLGENFADYSNFRSRLLKLGILQDTGEKVIRAAGRPASLYRFDPIAFAPLQETPLVFV
ncbi:nicotinate-nucleotide adenylyltransferase [Thermosynechococcaceae cyanobacterium BACA0444]|uniref:nicotinate-nucleotide adenylyltransferase n=1 Tax=Pseudocalidococcus azoricus BACA0444 TaxID=2918990 RepID=A0AAE4FUR5_9CYAN|nr:nicotinate-nucleotide adenylyltransferase [Pseudocalidococcus azoricus]MDS3862238.1 nicotinate-nucleotide adenylyltransferase [Pseudocalidococcus azoricus BACA0444]